MNFGQKWEDEQYINKGGFSEVYKVKLNGKVYALKKILPHLVKSEMHREAIEREIAIMQTLDHPKIIKLYQTIIDEDQINLLLEYAGGGSVHDQLKNYGKLPQHQVKLYVKDVIEALEYLHTRPNAILHRDIKPENLLICYNHHCKLADFGAANFVSGQRLSYRGTEQYMAPEVIQHQPHGRPYDIWCIGVLTYELLTGQVPKQGIPYPDFLSRAAEDFIKKILVIDQQKRMTMKELKEHIWLVDDSHKIMKISSKEKINKLQKMKKTLRAKLQEKSPQWKTTSSILANKQKSVIEENQELNSKNQVFINKLKEKQELKEQIMKNQKRIQREERRRRAQRPFLLQQIDRLKCAIKQYENNINILKAHPLKKQSQCLQNFKVLIRRIEQLTDYVQQLPQRLKVDLLYFSEYQPQIEIIPVSQYILKRKTQMLQNHREALIDLIDAKNMNKRIHEMISMHSQLQEEAPEEKPEESMNSIMELGGGKKKTL